MMPWEKKFNPPDGPQVAVYNRASHDGIPGFLRRDKNNVAPWMRLCDDEGCPRHGTAHECVNRADSLPTSFQNWVPPWLATS